MKSILWSKIGGELHPFHLFASKQILPSIVSGALIGIMTSILSISFAVLVFENAVPEAMSAGIGMALFSNIILHLGAAFTSSGEGVVAHTQSIPPPIQAVMMLSIMSIIPISHSLENRVNVAVFMMMLSAIFTGLTLFILGKMKWGNLIKHLPFPIICAFLGFVGLSLLIGGLTSMTQLSVNSSTIKSFFTLDLTIKWVPGLILAALLQVITSRIKGNMVFPLILGLALFLFSFISVCLGVNTSYLMENNWLLGTFENAPIWQLPAYSQITTINWSFILPNIGIIASLPLVSFIGGLLMVSAIEVTTDKEIDPNFELEIIGLSNLVSGIFGGGFIGYPSTTFTVMQFQLGATTRFAGILSALITALILFIGTHFLGYIPRFIIGGLLIFFGYQFIYHWVIKTVQTSLVGWKEKKIRTNC